MTVNNQVRNRKPFTPTQKEQYKEKKEAEKQALFDLYKHFLEKKTVQDFIGIVANYKQIHNYSLRNAFLVIAQAEERGDKEFIGILNSFLNWKKQDIHILKGSKAYKVLVPIFYKKKPEHDTSQSEEDKVLRFFKLGNVFDISQTTELENYRKEREEIDRVIMKNAEIDYETASDFVKNNFPEVKITEDFKDQDKKGSYDPITKKITLYERSSHTVFHEIGHHITVDVLKIAGDITKNYAKNEILAELSCYLLTKRFSETMDYNFAYSNCWASRIEDAFELTEFETCYKEITEFLTTLMEGK